MLEHLQTEQPNQDTEQLDMSSTLEIVTRMNEAEKTVPTAVEAALPAIAEAIDRIVERMKAGGKLFYTGAGTSGRLGILDAAECPPTFSTPSDLVQSIIAGGKEAVFDAVEYAEDDESAGASELAQRGVRTVDTVVGLSASGRTPFVIGSIKYAKSVGALTVGVSCNLNSVLGRLADMAINIDTGPEILMGSTRLKAGTAQKMVLNMISTATMVRLGKVYKNLMVDLKATNYKLLERSKRIVMLATDCSYDTASSVLEDANGHVKLAILMLERGVSAQVATALLDGAQGHLRRALRNTEDS